LNAAALLHESEEQALSKAAWFGFKVSPSAGKSLALERLEFQIQRSNENAPKHYAIFAELGGRTERIGGGSLSNRSSNANHEFDPCSVDLSPLASLKNLSAPVTFQIYLFGGVDNPQAPGNVRIDNISLIGKSELK
ncbi:MAG: hypothetical protein ACK49N_00020, partial [Verrucomicrobiota bacterium]